MLTRNLTGLLGSIEINLSEPLINKKMIECKNCVWPWIHLSTIIGILKWRTSQDDQFFLAFTFLCQTHKKQLMGSNTFLSDLLVRRKKWFGKKKFCFTTYLKNIYTKKYESPFNYIKNNQYCFFRTVCRVIFIFFSSNVQNVSHNQLRRPLLPLESFKNVFGCFSN